MICDCDGAGVVVGVSCAIIILIFMAQRFGTGRVGAGFAPIVVIYFLCNLIIAITNITRYKPSIFKVSCHAPILSNTSCCVAILRLLLFASLYVPNVCRCATLAVALLA